MEGRAVRIARPDVEIYDFAQDPGAFLEPLKRCGTRIDLFTFIQPPADTVPRFSYPMEPDNWAVLSVSSYADWWAKQANDRARNKVRKAVRSGVATREVPFGDGLVRDIWEIYNECPVRQGKPSRHYGKSLEVVHREEATYLGNSIFLGAFVEDQMIGFIKMLVHEGNSYAKTLNVVSMVRYWDKAAMNALIAEAVRTCCERSIPYLVFGKFVYGNKQPDGLSAFKRSNGFERIELPRYYVPLNSLGAAAVRFGFHRRLIDRLPEALLSRVRAARNAWYGRELRQSRAGALEQA